MRQEQAAETKQKLLDSARKLFAERGFSGTPVRSINRSVGLADGLLYHYFLKNRYRWLPELLKQRAEAGEIREMDYESAADTIIALMINHLMAKLVGIVPPHLSDPQKRARLIRYQVSLWKIPRP